MNRCSICDHMIEGPHFGVPETGEEFHHACLAQRALEDVVIAVIATTLLMLAPPIIVWAG